MASVDLSAVRLTDTTPQTLAFRGYNQANLGRTPELFAVDAYRSTIEGWLRWADRLCAEHADLKTDLVARVERREEPPPSRYAEAVALVFATEMAQLQLAREAHGLQIAKARFSFGYSLGELVALAAGGFVSPEKVLSVPLALADDCARLAANAQLAVIFSRRKALPFLELASACEQLSDAENAIAISAVLSPNSVLVIGQGDRLQRLPRVFPALRGVRIHPHTGVWPPLHTPLVRQQGVCDRARQMIASAMLGAGGPSPPVFSLVTGRVEYRDGAPREVLAKWIDHPQQLWSGVKAVLASDVQRVLHVGPAPNVIPATFSRLAENVRQQTAAATARGMGLRTVQSIVDRRWLAALLPADASLLRAPKLQHIVLEDWLLAHAPGSSGVAADSSSSSFVEASAGGGSVASGSRYATASTELR